MTTAVAPGRHRMSRADAQEPRPRSVRSGLVGLMLAVGLVGAAVVAPQAMAATQQSASQRIVAVAKRYVHHARYREGGASPRRGFDCSGYTKYVYNKAHVAKLPHNAESQRRMHHMHRVSKKQRRTGDLIFYMSGGHAYHVAIYAGHGEQYAATTPGGGIKHQHIWSKHVRYGRYVS
ncbi:C40 family peptidase [uncultured Jatrophihabitans sp.]|uniref:C40 family peptidase n=1 Tax=uncultured Jatrophihabitans sp. TaxID=1610747 RepID=UPI0035CBF064